MGEWAEGGKVGGREGDREKEVETDRETREGGKYRRCIPLTYEREYRETISWGVVSRRACSDTGRSSGFVPGVSESE